VRGWVLTSTGEESTVFRVPVGAVKTVGRATRADFILDEALVSRVHCRLVADKSDQLVVEDLESTNGTLVNGQIVTRHVLKAGDRLTIGKTEFEVSAS
jgi:pSer/pThr/pTyr-binding forkhead associated (FHA) protein